MTISDHLCPQDGTVFCPTCHGPGDDEVGSEAVPFTPTAVIDLDALVDVIGAEAAQDVVNALAGVRVEVTGPGRDTEDLYVHAYRRPARGVLTLYLADSDHPDEGDVETVLATSVGHPAKHRSGITLTVR